MLEPLTEEDKNVWLNIKMMRGDEYGIYRGILKQ